MGVAATKTDNTSSFVIKFISTIGALGTPWPVSTDSSFGSELLQRKSGHIGAILFQGLANCIWTRCNLYSRTADTSRTTNTPYLLDNAVDRDTRP